MASSGPEVAGRYDDEAVRGDEEAASAFLASLAPGGSALELAIGTGRIALPLAERGVRVDGIDLSPAGLRLRKRWGGWRGEPFTGTALRVTVYERP